MKLWPLQTSCVALLNDVVFGLVLTSSLLFLTAPLWSTASRDLEVTRKYIEQHSHTAKWTLPASQQRGGK